jgi:hypothetical protein
LQHRVVAVVDFAAAMVVSAEAVAVASVAAAVVVASAAVAEVEYTFQIPRSVPHRFQAVVISNRAVVSIAAVVVAVVVVVLAVIAVEVCGFQKAYQPFFSAFTGGFNNNRASKSPQFNGPATPCKYLFVRNMPAEVTTSTIQQWSKDITNITRRPDDGG